MGFGVLHFMIAMCPSQDFSGRRSACTYCSTRTWREYSKYACLLSASPSSFYSLL